MRFKLFYFMRLHTSLYASVSKDYSLYIASRYIIAVLE